jgi:hypothetical protein
MSSTTPTDRESTRTVQIPSLTTNSLRAILEAFETSIIDLRAHGSVTTTNQTTIDELRAYGVTREQETNHRITIDYTDLRTNEGELSNPLDQEAIETLYEHLRAVLDDDARDVKPDLAVTSLTIRVTEEALQEVTPAQTPEFDLRFVADPAEPAAQKHTERSNADRGLYTQLGFEFQNLNLRTVTETVTKFTEKSDGRYLSWQGPDDIRPRAPWQLAVRINDRVLPDEYGLMKHYKIVDDHTLELDEEALDDDDELDTANTEGGDE